jgi:hypothetical protein
MSAVVNCATVAVESAAIWLGVKPVTMEVINATLAYPPAAALPLALKSGVRRFPTIRRDFSIGD